MNTLFVDFDKVTGRIKEFHAINNAPISGLNTNRFKYLKQAGIPYSRLHDTGGTYGGNRYVDIENVFRDFSADVNDAASYDFAFTDFLLQEICAQGTEPFYRLGATIENGHKIRAYRIFPPKDNLKWAKICKHIIMHYNEGWANGFHMGIKYWEIWNEPDNQKAIEDNPMWKGTKEEYYKLYEVTANYLKERFPDIKIGGYASSGLYGIEEGYDSEGIPGPRAKYLVEFFEEFLKYISDPKTKAPLDFFSWHSYENSERSVYYARYVREMLDKYGFENTESILNEWNPGIEYRGKEEDAARILTMITYLHHEPLDKLMYYDGQVNGSYQGIFNPLSEEPFPAYNSFLSFNELYKLRSAAYVESDLKPLPAVAATDGKCGKILFANEKDTELTFNLKVGEGWKFDKFRVISGNDGMISAGIARSDEVSIPAKKIAMMEFIKK